MRLFGHRYHQCDDPWSGATPREIEVREMLRLILIKQEIIMGIAQDLEDEVSSETTVIASVETVVQNLVDAVKAAGTDKAQLDRVLAAAVANKTRLGALAAANTPAATPAPVPPIVG